MFTITGSASLDCESDSDPKMVFWNESTNCCSWEGVTCDWLHGHVIGLDLSCSTLCGTIQANSSLFHLCHLQRLNLVCNDFNLSGISSKFGLFVSFTHLTLSCSNFTGRIPSKISYLSKLISLDLSYPGRLEQHTFNMLLQNPTQLRELQLDWLNISSPLPQTLLNLSSLRSLSLVYCHLRGKFSENIFHLPNLRKLNLRANIELTGKLPNFNVTSSLQFLDLSWTSFSGQPPDSINNLKALNSLYLSQCNFSRSIPASVCNLTQITDLDISSNSFSRQIPSSISNLAKLTNLILSLNNLNGQIPDSLGNMSQLIDLDISVNQLTGLILSYAIRLLMLTSLQLSRNSLNGTIPSSLFALPSLINIDLSDNKLQGSVPGSVYELQNLADLVLSSNKLSGVMDIDKLLKLKNPISLDLSYNGLSLSINNSVNSTLTNFDADQYESNPFLKLGQ